MDGSTQLNPKLVNYSVMAKSMACDYVTAAINGTSSKVKKMCVTAKEVEESQKVENMTIAEIHERIIGELAKLPPQNAVQMEAAYHATIKSGLKAKHIAFYYQVLEECYLHDIVANEDESVPNEQND